jgi:hypothetical protein
MLPTPVHNDDLAPWTPLSVAEVVDLFRGASFFWCLAGGRAIERVVGRAYRPHQDIDIVVLRPQQLAVQDWLSEWRLAAADPPGSLRPWLPAERLPWRVHDVWAHREGAAGWELQLMLQEADAQSWYFRRDDRVHGPLDGLASVVDGLPCLRVDLQLLFKAKRSRPRDEMDFQAVLPSLTAAQRLTLAEWLRLTCPNGHDWIAALEREGEPGSAVRR